MRVKAVIDRFEGDKAVLLAGETEIAASWPRKLLPEGAKEGDILQVTFSIDPDATRNARAEAEDLLNQLLKQQDKEG